MSKAYADKHARRMSDLPTPDYSKYGISDTESAAIESYRQRIGNYDWKSSYKYNQFDVEDMERQAQGIIPKSLQKTYKNTAVDRALFYLGLPSQSKIESVASKADSAREKRIKEGDKIRQGIPALKEEIRKNKVIQNFDLEDYIGGMGTGGTFQRDENGYLPAATSTAQATSAPAASNTADASVATTTTPSGLVYDPSNVDRHGITWKGVNGIGIDENGDLYTKNLLNQQIFKVQDKEAFLRMQSGDLRSSTREKQPVRDEENKITWQDDNWGIGDNGVYYVKDKDGTIRRQYETSNEPVAIEGKASDDIFLPDSDGRYSINGQLMTADELREAVKDLAFGNKSTGVVKEGVSYPGVPYVYYTNQEASRYIDRRAEKDKETADKARAAALTDKYYNETLPSRSDFDEVAAKGADVEIPVANRTGKLSGYDMSSNPYENTARAAAGENSLLNYMTPDERKIYDYLRGTGNKQAAQKYWDTIVEDLETRWTNRAIVQGEVEGKEQGWLSALLNKAGDSVAGTITGTAHILSQTVQGKEVNPYNSAFAGQMAAGAALDSATENWSPTAKKAINIFSSMLDNAARYGLLGPAGKAASLGFMAMGAFQNSYRDVKARGGNDEQAMSIGLLNGAIEVATESLGFDRMMAAFNGSATARNAWEYAINQTLLSMFPEGMEELAAEAADIIVDEVVMKDKSEIQQAIAEYKQKYPNASQQDIFTLVNDMIRERSIDVGIGGMVSGGFMTGTSSLAGASMNAIGERQNIIDAQNLLEDVGYILPEQTNNTTQTTYNAANEIGQQYALEQQLQEVERQLDVDPENLQLQMEYVRITDALNRGDYSSVDAAQEDAAGETLDNQIAEQAAADRASERTNALRKQPYADLLNELNQTRFSSYGISDTMRKTMGNAVNLTGNTDISAKYAELSQRFPSLFPANVEGTENQLGQINRVVRQLRSGQIDAREADLSVFRDDAQAQQAAVEAREAARRQMQSLQDRLNGIPDKTSKQALKLQAQIDVLAPVAGTQTQTQNAEELANLTERLSAYDAFPGQEVDPIVSGAQSFVGDNTNTEFESEQDRIQRLIQQANQQQTESSMLYPFTQQEQNMFERAEWERKYQKETRQAEVETPVEQTLPVPEPELEEGEELYVPPERDYADYGPTGVTVIQPKQTSSNQEMQPLPVPETPQTQPQTEAQSQTEVLPQSQRKQRTRETRRTVPRVTDLTPQEVQHITEWSDAVEKYGAQDMGMEPSARHDAVPKSVDGVTKVSKSVRTLYESPATPDTAVADFEQAVLSGLGSYTVQTFDQVINAANTRRANADSDVAQAAADFDAEIDGSMAGRSKRSLSVTAEDIAYAAILYKEAMAKSDTKTAHNIAATTASIMTNYGQVINAMKLFKLMTPEGRFSVYERLAQQAAREASWFKKGMTFDIEIDPALKDAFIKADIAATQDASDANMAALREAETAIKKNIAEQVPVTMRSRIDALRNLNMLGNFKTYARNAIGNVTMLGQRYLRDKISGLYQDVFIHDPSKQTATWRSELTQEQKAEAKAWAYQQAQENQSTLQGQGGKYSADMNEIRDMSRQIAGENNVFDKVLFTLSDFVGDKLEDADATFLKINYRQSLYEFMKAQNLTVDQMQGQTLAMAQSYATLQALKATYRDNSKLADAIRKMSDSGGLASFLIEGLMPYKRTPINIAKRGVEYSPLGWANVLRLALGAKSKGYTGAQIANAAAEATVGTGLAVLGYILVKSGILRASGSDPDKANYEKGMGKQSYSLDTPFGNVSLDWLQPTSMPLFVGARFAELQDGLTGADGETRPADMIGMGLDALTSVVSPVLEMSCMNGLQDAIESVQYQQIGENAPVTIALNLALSYVSQLTQNSLLKQVARSIDPIRRDPYYSTAQTAGGQAIERLFNQTVNGIPGLSQMLPEYINKDGEADRYWEEGDEAGALWNLVQQTVLPWNTGRGTSTPLDEERLSVYDATGENVLSSQNGKTVRYNGETYHLEAPERVEYKQNYGRIQAEYGEHLLESEGYRMAGPEMRASMLKDLASYAKAQADIRFLRSRDIEVDPKSNASSAFKTAAKIDLAMERGIYIGDYLAVKYVKSQIGSVKDPISGKTIKDGNARRLEEYMKQIGLTQDQIEFMQEVLN